MTYGEVFYKWFTRILLIVLAISLTVIVATSVVKARQAVDRTDALIARCDAWAERGKR